MGPLVVFGGKTFGQLFSTFVSATRRHWKGIHIWTGKTSQQKIDVNSLLSSMELLDAAAWPVETLRVALMKKQ